MRMNKKGKGDLDAIKLLLALGFGGIFSVAMIILFHTGYFGWGLLCLAGVFFTWLLDNEVSNPIISSVLLLGGFIEVFGFEKILFGIVLVVLACLAFFIPKVVD